MRHLLTDSRFTLSLGAIVLLIVMALLGPFIAPYPSDSVSSRALAPPGSGHLLGTDEFGRDVLSRLILGARLTVLVSVGAVALAASIGTALGLAGGYFGGWIELVTMRIVDAILSFPPFLVAMFVITFLGPDLGNLIGTIGVLYIPRYARVAHAVTLGARDREYVLAARAIGAPVPRILLRAIAPNLLAPLIVQVSLGLGSAVLTESGLSFLGLGPPPPTPSWGRIVQQSARFMTVSSYPVVSVSVVISAAVLAFNILGDSLRDHLDPTLRRL